MPILNRYDGSRSLVGRLRAEAAAIGRHGIGERLAGRQAYPLILAANRAEAPDIDEHTITYGQHPAQRLLWFRRPEQPVYESLVFYIHGGGWRGDSPEQHRYAGRFFARRAWAAVVCGYRLAPSVRFPGQRDDVFAGLTRTVEYATQQGFTGRVVIAGLSAGAQLAALLVYDRAARQASGVETVGIDGLLTIAGVLDFSHCTTPYPRGIIRDYLAPGADPGAADPLTHVQGDETTPVLAVHGDRDGVVPFANTAAFVRRANRGAGAPAEMIAVRGGRHAGIMRMFCEPRPETRLVDDWLRRIKRT